MTALYKALEFKNNIPIIAIVMILAAMGLTYLVALPAKDKVDSLKSRLIAAIARLLPWLLYLVTELDRYATAKAGYFSWYVRGSLPIKALLIAIPVLLGGSFFAALIVRMPGAGAKLRAAGYVFLCWAGMIVANINIAGHFSWDRMEIIFGYYIGGVLLAGVIGSLLEVYMPRLPTPRIKPAKTAEQTEPTPAVAAEPAPEVVAGELAENGSDTAAAEETVVEDDIPTVEKDSATAADDIAAEDAIPTGEDEQPQPSETTAGANACPQCGAQLPEGETECPDCARGSSESN